MADALSRRVETLLSDPKRRPVVLIALLVGVLLFSGLGWWLSRPPEIAVVEIQPGPVEIALSVVARVRPDNLVDVRSPNAGQVIRLLHDDGDLIAAGAPLAIVRSTVEQAQADANSARERAARAELDRAQLAFNRTRTLADRGFASAAALDEARATLRSAQAGLAAASAERRATAAQTREFTIRAPMAGVVLVRPIDNGQVISPETTLFQLGSRDDIELQADVDEAYGDVLRTGMEARAALSGSDEIFAARISEVSPRVDPTTGGRLIKLAPVEPASIPPGRSVDVTIIVARREQGIAVPRQTIIDASTEPKVYVVDANDRVIARAIEIADWPSLNAIIDSGLARGDRVVLAPADTRAGAHVRARAQAPISTPAS
ncbi:hemolysin secretion protein D [Candidatus Viadribacter manganicus]|uniref:Hemolysin secretion protein D n=2 Tax=Candidatus Viadribacter manganicus TaxID=1759059 RepID=A0A1B1AN41_9PROT|nr:hemolysin secretion protein D [Candidatus Viadribacter manganicus]